MRALALVHRWLGALLCVPFAVWFLSGCVMAFAGFPSVSEGERLLRAAPLAASRVRVPLQSAASTLDFVPERVRLAMLADQPLWRFEAKGRAQALDAETGAPVAPLPEAAAPAVAAPFFDSAAPGFDVERLEAPDQWTPHSERRSELPLVRVLGHDAERTQVYVSLARAEVVQRTTRAQRVAAWAGAIPHWWYPVQLRRHGAEWRTVVLVGSGIGTAVCLLGLVLGVVYWRQRRGASGSRRWSPYADGWLRYHHLFGLGCGAFTLSWVFSGMLSLNPGRWSPGPIPSANEDAAFRAPAPDLAGVVLGAREAVERCSQELAVKALELVHVAGKPFWLCSARWDESRLIAADRTDRAPELELGMELLAAAARSAAGAELVRVERLEAGDAYVYPTHLDPEVRFPMLRFQFANDTWLYVDPRSASLAWRYTGASRAERWLYQGLHRLDFAALYRVPWLWRTVVVALCLSGAAFSVTGVAVALRWLAPRWVAPGRLSRRRRHTQDSMIPDSLGPEAKNRLDLNASQR